MGLLTFLSGCAGGPSLKHYTDTGPELDLKEYFTGTIKAWGIIQDFNGNVTRRFDVTMVGTWDGDVGTLEEDFIFYDGEEQKRIWTITRTGENTYSGTAGDILGEAEGEANGNAVRWAYKMDLARRRAHLPHHL